MSLDRVTSSLGSVRGLLGFVSVAATLALTSPGVQIARASDEVPSTRPNQETSVPVESAEPNMSVDPALVRATRLVVQQEAGPSCSTSPGLRAARVEQQIERLQREIRQRASQQSPGEAPIGDGIVLNGRGYNYRSGRSAKSDKP
jgi:hypothetical protein